MSMADRPPCSVRRRQSRRPVQPGSQGGNRHGLSKTTQSSQEKHQEGDQSRQAKTNPETPPEENPSSSRQASRESQTITKVASAFAPQSRRVHRVHSQHLWSADSSTLAVELISGEVNKSITQAWPYNSRLMAEELKVMMVVEHRSERERMCQSKSNPHVSSRASMRSCASTYARVHRSQRSSAIGGKLESKQRPRPKLCDSGEPRRGDERAQRIHERCRGGRAPG